MNKQGWIDRDPVRRSRTFGWLIQALFILGHLGLGQSFGVTWYPAILVSMVFSAWLLNRWYGRARREYLEGFKKT